MLDVTAVIELVYVDASGSTGAIQMRAASTHTVAEIDAAANAVASIIASVTNCVLVRQRIKYKVRNIPDGPAAIGSSIKRRGVLFFATSTDRPDTLVEIPGIISDVLVTDGPCAGYCIDLSNTDIAALSSVLISEGVTNPFSDAVTALVAGYIQSRV